MTSWQKTTKYIAMAFAILLCIGIIGGSISLLALLFGLGRGSETADFKGYAITQEVTKLRLDLGTTRLTIQEGDTLRVEVRSPYLKVTEKDGTLSIREKRPWLNLRGWDSELRIYVPAGTIWDEADIDGGAGTITIDTLSARRLKLNLGAGKMDVQELNVWTQADIDGGAGQISIEGGTMTNLNLDMGVGSLTIQSRLQGSSSLDLGVGLSQITLLGDKEDYYLKLRKGMGELRLNGEKLEANTVYGAGPNRIDVDGGVGSVQLSFDEP